MLLARQSEAVASYLIRHKVFHSVHGYHEPHLHLPRLHLPHHFPHYLPHLQLPARIISHRHGHGHGRTSHQAHRAHGHGRLAPSPEEPLADSDVRADGTELSLTEDSISPTRSNDSPSQPGLSMPGDAMRACMVMPEEMCTPAAAEARHQRLEKAASRIREPSYTLSNFHADMVYCFPELVLYLARPIPGDPQDAVRGLLAADDGVGLSAFLVANGELPAAFWQAQLVGTRPAVVRVTSESSVASTASTASTTSGNSPFEEYNRTMGALFAVYWLARLELPQRVAGSLGLDGQRGFTFGVDEETWQPLDPELSVDDPNGLMKKKTAFLSNQDWDGLHQLLVDAEILQQHRPGEPAAVHTERMVSMLALTAVHDLMKNPALLPTVAREHAPYQGFQAGEVITDHDVALGYVLEYDVAALPCLGSLTEEQRAPIRFTQVIPRALKRSAAVPATRIRPMLTVPAMMSRRVVCGRRSLALIMAGVRIHHPPRPVERTTSQALLHDSFARSAASHHADARALNAFPIESHSQLCKRRRHLAHCLHSSNRSSRVAALAARTWPITLCIG